MKKDKKNKNILFLSRLYYPHIGGVEKHIAQISEILIKEDYEVTVVCEQHDKKLKTKEQINGINIIRIPINSSEKNKKFHIWKWVLKNRKFIKSFDIVHIHDIFYWILPLLVYLDRKKIFITFHGYESYPIKHFSKIQKKIAVKYCSGSICIGEFINKWYEITSSAVIYGAVEKSKITPKMANKQFSAVFFGRLDAQTGIKEYYKSFLLLKKKYKSFIFRVVGEGEYKSKLNKINISPFKSDISTYIQNSRFIFVSRYLSMLEAMVEKRLVIAVYTDPIKQDYLVGSPFSKYVEVCSSTKEIVSRVKYFVENPKEEKRKVEKAYRWAAKQSWKNAAKTYKTIWKI